MLIACAGKTARVRLVEAVSGTKYMWRSGVERCCVGAGE